MSPRRTLISCGTSSMEVRRNRRPTGVTRGSSVNLKMPTLSFRAASASRWAWAPSTMLRNLIISNVRPSRPTRRWRKNTGPYESTLIASAMSRPNGNNTSKPAPAPNTSIARFTAREERLRPPRGTPRTVTPPTVSNSTAEPTTSNRRGTIEIFTPSAVARDTASSIVSGSAVVGIRKTRWTSRSRTSNGRSSKVCSRLRRDLGPQSLLVRRSSSSGRKPTISTRAPGSDASDRASCSLAPEEPTIRTRSGGAASCANARAVARETTSSAEVDSHRTLTLPACR